MELEKACVVEQPEAVGYLPLNLEIGGIERLRPQRRCHGQANKRKNQI
jgi:hypothetical protein